MGAWAITVSVLFLHAQGLDAPIKKLGSDDPAERLAAYRTLCALGEKARPKLEAAAKRNSTRWWAEAALEELRARREGGDAWSAKRMSLHADREPLDEILERFAEDLGYGLSKPVTLDLKGVSPLIILERLASSVNGRAYFSHGAGILSDDDGNPQILLKAQKSSRWRDSRLPLTSPRY